MSSKRRLRSAFFFTSLSAGLVISTPLRAAERLEPGQWEFTLTTDGASHTSAHCVTPAEAGQVNGDVAAARAAAEKKAAGHCTVKSYGIRGETVSYSLACGNRTIDSVTTFHGETSEGTLTTTVQGAKPAVTHVKARRVGACTPAS
jgi:hypothetical protein